MRNMHKTIKFLIFFIVSLVQILHFNALPPLKYKRNIEMYKILLFLIILIQIHYILKYTMAEDIDAYKKKHPLPRILANTENCPINACEAVKVMSQYFLLVKSSGKLRPQDSTPSPSPTTSYLGKIDPFTLEFELQKKVRQIESRLRAVEQPVWKLTPGSQEEWNHCTAGVCRCNPDTKTFTCWNLNLISVPITQVIPMNMVYIDLSRNLLSTLHKDTFRKLTLLLELHLSNNHLDFLPFDLFRDCDSLVQLRLQSNQLEDLDARTFWKLRNLNLLDISKNVLRELPENIFNNMQRLRVINLSDNRIKKFPAALLNDQKQLEELDISRNEIQFLESGSFYHQQELRILDFAENQIYNIKDDVFSTLISLRTLTLHNNRLPAIPKELFENLENLISLDLTLNRIIKIHGEAFSHLKQLRELYLGQNTVSTIPEGLFLNLENLSRLMLFSNNLTALQSNNFLGLKSLKNLMLNNNILKKFDFDAFQPLKKLEKLRIDSNKLQYLPQGTLNNLPSLLAVKLDKNPWHCDCRALYLARWIREHVTKLWDCQPMCRGPGDLGGNEVGLLRYDDLCDGQWASMLSLSPRLPVRKHQILNPKNFSDYVQMYNLKYYSTINPKDVDSTTAQWLDES